MILGVMTLKTTPLLNYYYQKADLILLTNLKESYRFISIKHMLQHQ